MTYNREKEERERRELMDVRKVVVVVEEVEISRAALNWALQNLVRFGDFIILLHVFPSSLSKNNNKTRFLRLKGYHLALSFQEICSTFPNGLLQTKVEIIVTEGDDYGAKITAIVREIGASSLVVGLHDSSFLYKLATAQSNIAHSFHCKVVAIKQPPPSPLASRTAAEVAALDSFNSMDFSQVEIARLHVPEVAPPRIPYRICPSPSAIIWRSRRSMRK